MPGGMAPDLLVDEVEIGELARVGAGALLAGGWLLLLGQEVAPGVHRLLFLIFGAGASRRRAAASGCHPFSLPRFRRRRKAVERRGAEQVRRPDVSRAALSFRGQWLHGLGLDGSECCVLKH